TDARNRPSPLYVKQALTCIKKQLGSVTIDELFVSFADISAPPAATSNYDNISLLPQKPKRLVYERRHVQQTSNGELESNGEEESSGEQETNTDLASTGEHSPNSENPPNGEQCSSSPGEIGNGSSNETDESDMLRYHKVWRMVNRLKADGDATKIGICDVSKQQLAQLCEHSGAQPDMVQIRVADPAAEPDAAATELRAYASERGISIRTHSDSMAMLSNATFQALAADYRINERFPTTEVPPEGYKIDLMRPRWVANYSVAIRNRGLVANRGYIVMASSDRMLSTAVVHPLVLLNISEHTTRTLAQVKRGKITAPQYMCGAVLGRQVETKFEAFLSFELKLNEASTERAEFDLEHFTVRLEQLKIIFPSYDFIGWYAVSTSRKLTPGIAQLHEQIIASHASAILMVFDAALADGAASTDGSCSLPICVYETLAPVRVERTKLEWYGDAAGTRQPGVEHFVASAVDHSIPTETTVWASRLVPIQVTLDSGEAERIAVEHV
ncbi:COP9 signalosome complex subunit 6, partial [Coemansia sp. RSA 1937]